MWVVCKGGVCVSGVYGCVYVSGVCVNSVRVGGVYKWCV